MAKQDHVPNVQGLKNRLRKSVASHPPTEEEILKHAKTKKPTEPTEAEVLGSKDKEKQPHRRARPTPEDIKPAPPGPSEAEILKAKDLLEVEKRSKRGILDDVSEVDLTEEDVQRSQDVKDKNRRLNKAVADPVLETESDRKPKKKVKEITDADERKVSKKIPVVSFIQAFATEIGCKVATDVLGSDVAFWYPFGCAPLDIVFGGGIPSGKIIECFGWESSGKSTLTLEASKAFTRYWKAIGSDDYVILWLESESALDKVRAQYIGCDLSRFVVVEVDTVDYGFDTIKMALEKAREKGIHVFISWDTIAAVLTKNEKTGEFAGGMGDKARLIRRLLKDVSTLLGQTNSTLFFVNQLYQNLSPYGEKDIVPGGGGIKFHASIRCLMKKNPKPIERYLENGQVVASGIEVDLYTKKNKLTLPYQTCKLVINNESGLDVVETLGRFLILNKFINVKGGWKYIEFGDEEYKFQNTDGLKEILEVKCPDLRTYMDYLCYHHFSTVSPLMKVKLLNNVWEYELKLYGEKKTKITDEEFSLATLLGRSVLEKQDKEG